MGINACGFYRGLFNAFLPKFFPKAFVERIAGRIYEPKNDPYYSALV